jgi:ABC-type sugar transport system substrate-binding protein
MRRTFGLVALLVTAALGVTACGQGREESSGSEGAAKKKIAVFIPNGGDPYYQNKSYGYSEAAKELNADVQMFDSGGYENVEKQIAQIEDAIQRKVSAIVVTATDSKGVCGPIEQALAAGIPVVADDVMPSCDKPVPYGVSENSVNVGKQECLYLAKAIGGKGNIVLMKGPPGAKIAIDRANGCKEGLKDYPDVKVVGEQWGPSNIETGNKLMDDFLSANKGKIDAAYTFGAITALGAVNALKSAGQKPGDVKLATIDYHPEVLRYMEDKWIEGTIPAQPVRLAKMAATAAAALADKKAVEGESGADQCCEKRAYTADENVVTLEMFESFDTSNAVAPDGWKPPLQG